MIIIKNDGEEGTDAKVKGMQPEILLAIIIANELLNKMFKTDLTLTSVTDSHKDKLSSLHNVGMAFDMRTWGMSGAEKATFSRELRNLLGEEYDVVEEGSHIHVEFDPKDVESEPKLGPAVLTEEENQELLEEVYEDSKYESRLESKIDKILEWIKYHGDDMKCQSLGEECKAKELEGICRIDRNSFVD